jgi:hypothetical protein
MARCKHGFELSSVVCPSGCGGTRKQQQQVAKGKRLPEAAKEARVKAPNSSFTDERLLEVLASAPTARAAAGRLGCSLTTLQTRVKKTRQLREAYAACRDRGRESSRRFSVPMTRRAG